MVLRKLFITIISAVLLCLLVACQSSRPAPSVITPTATNTLPVDEPTAVVVPVIEATLTPEPPASRSLVVCLPDEPETLYIYGGSSRSMWSVLEAIYDGPFDTRSYDIQPVILQKIPNLADGSAQLRPVKMRAGETVVDASGNLVVLQAGTRVLPSGCTSTDCSQVWDGSSELMMDQLAVTFELLPGLKWSDGSPLTSADSVFSYAIAADPATPVTKTLVDRTFSYQASGDLSVEWVGLPGYFDSRYGAYFWFPLPRHSLGMKGASDLLADPATARTPLGWGPYILAEWVSGDHISLVRNPNYFRAGEGLPYFDSLVFRFVGRQGDNSVAALQAGECDVVDQNTEFYPMFPALLESENQGKLKTYVSQGPEWEHLNFGIGLASYEDGYDPAAGDRPDLFGDVRTRRAFANCIDRQGIVDELLYRRSQVPLTFIPANHPLLAQGLPEYVFDAAAGARLLDEVGWKDVDANPNTPRIAQGVQNVPDGTPLVVNFLTTEAPLRKQVAERVSESLRACGVQINLQFANAGDVFAPGPSGPVFGRQFDLVQFAWEASARLNCQIYTTAQIPGANNQWIGANVSGYTSQEFDQACANAAQARPGEASYSAAVQAVQMLFSEQLPVIPLYAQLKIALARPDLCGMDLDVTTRSIFWNLEMFNFGLTCP